jgi:hypothetical protein
MIPMTADEASVLASHPDTLKATKPYAVSLSGAGRAYDMPAELPHGMTAHPHGPAARLSSVNKESDSYDVRMSISRLMP